MPWPMLMTVVDWYQPMDEHHGLMLRQETAEVIEGRTRRHCRAYHEYLAKRLEVDETEFVHSPLQCESRFRFLSSS